MNDDHKYLNCLLNSLSEYIESSSVELGGELKLSLDSNTLRLAYINKTTGIITFNPRTILYISLFNKKTTDIFRDFVLASQLKLFNYYTECCAVSERLLKRITKNKQDLLSCFKQVKNKLEYILLFIISHEIGHYYFSRNKDVWENYRKKAFNIIRFCSENTFDNDYANEYIRRLKDHTTIMKFFENEKDTDEITKAFLELHMYFMADAIEDAKRNDVIIEEIAADIIATDVVFGILKNNCSLTNEIGQWFYVTIIESLNFLMHYDIRSNTYLSTFSHLDHSDALIAQGPRVSKFTLRTLSIQIYIELMFKDFFHEDIYNNDLHKYYFEELLWQDSYEEIQSDECDNKMDDIAKLEEGSFIDFNKENCLIAENKFICIENDLYSFFDQ